MADSHIDVRGPAVPVGPIPRPVAWLLIAPAAVLFLLSYVLPTIGLLRTVPWDAGRFWDLLFSSLQLRTLGYALSFALPVLLILATAAPAFAWAASRAGLVGRWVARAVLALPLAAYAPTGLALIWAGERVPALGDTRTVEIDARLAMVSMMGGFVFAVAATCYLSALRRPEPGGPTGRAAVTVGALLALVTLAAALQVYTFAAVTDGPVLRSAATPLPMVLLAQGGVRAFPHTALAVLAILMVLGVATALLVVRSGLRLEFDPTRASADDRTPSGVRTAALVGTGVGVVALLLFVVVQLGPWLAALATGETRWPAGFAAGTVLLSTWLVPLGTAIVQVVAAALAAFAITVGRPVGPASDRLLLVVAPWLLVGNGLLEMAWLNPPQRRSEGLESVVAYVPPSWLSLPALVVFVVLFRGLAASWSRSRAAGAPNAFARAMWPALPMVVLVIGVTWLVQAQDLLAPSVAEWGQGVIANGQVLAARTVLPGIFQADVVRLGYPLALLVLFTLGAIAFQLVYLDRLTARVGRAE
jgi:hypothetical protein